MLATNHVLHNVMYFSVLPPSELSDHSIVCTRLRCTFNCPFICEPQTDCRTSPLKGQYIWSDQCKLAYQTALVDVESTNCLIELENNLNNENININEINHKLTRIYNTTAASKTLLFKPPVNKRRKKETKTLDV